MKTLTHQKIRGILKRAGIKVGHYSNNRLGMAFFYGGNISVQNDWKDNNRISVTLDESTGMACNPIDEKVIEESRKLVISAVRKEIKDLLIEIDGNTIYFSIKTSQ